MILPPPACDDRLSSNLAALAHPARIRILRHLAESPACCCKDVVNRLDLAQSTVSQHLKILVDAGLVRFAPERPRSRYSINPDALQGLARHISCLIDGCCAAPADGAAPARDARLG